MEARVAVEAAAAGVVLRTRAQTAAEAGAEALTVPRRGGLEVEEDTSYLAAAEGPPHLAGMEAGVEVRRWELWKAVEEERLFLWQEGEEGPSYVEGGAAAEALPSMVEEVVVLAFAVHF